MSEILLVTCKQCGIEKDYKKFPITRKVVKESGVVVYRARTCTKCKDVNDDERKYDKITASLNRVFVIDDRAVVIAENAEASLRLVTGFRNSNPVEVGMTRLPAKVLFIR